MKNNNCTWTNLTDWTDCLTLFNISADDSENFLDNPLSKQLCLRRECSCRKLLNNSDDMDTNMDSESYSLNFTSPTWSEACRGFDVLFKPLEETIEPEPEPEVTIEPEPEVTIEPETEQNLVLALSAEAWKNCSCTWPLDTASRMLPCCNLNWFEILNKQNPNDWEALAVEYITAELNLLNGVVPEDDSFYTDLNTTMDILEICPGNWTTNDTANAEQLKLRLQTWNLGGVEAPITLRMSTGNEAEKSVITTTSGASKSSLLLLVLVPTIAVAILVFVGALIFINTRPTEESNEITNNI
jgi:hypothetical protein